jgi:hypothetical protein
LPRPRYRVFLDEVRRKDLHCWEKSHGARQKVLSLPWCRRPIKRAPTPLQTDDLQEDVRVTPNEVPASAPMLASAVVGATENLHQRRIWN